MAMSKQYTSMRKEYRQQAAMKKSGGGTKFNLPEGAAFFNPKKGTSKLRIVSYIISVAKHPSGRLKGDVWPERRFSMHYNVGADPKSYICPRSVGQRCPICEYRVKLSKSSNPDEQLIKDLRPKERVLYNVIDMNVDPNAVLLWDVSYYNFTKKLDEEINEGPEEYSDFAMPNEDGMYLSVRFAEKTMGASKPFLEASRIDFSPVEDAIPDELFEQALDLDKTLKVFSYEDLEAIFLEMDEGTGESGETPTDTPSEESNKEEPNKEESKKTTRAPRTSSKPKETDTSEEDAAAKAAAAEKARKDAIRAAKAAEKAAALKPQETENECPGGGIFGESTDTLEACDACPKWDACITKKELP